MFVALPGPWPTRSASVLLAALTAVSIAACGTSNHQSPTQSGTAAALRAPRPRHRRRRRWLHRHHQICSSLVPPLSPRLFRIHSRLLIGHQAALSDGTDREKPSPQSVCTPQPTTERTSMPAAIPTAGLSRLAIIAVTGAAAVSLAACGTSNNAKPPSASPTSSASASSSSPSAKGEARDWVKGMIDSVSGSTIQVSQRSGAATVDFTPSTKVAELTRAQLTDVTTGSCVSVRPERHGDSPDSNAITARSVLISTAADGTCPQPKQHAGAADTPPPGAPAPHRPTSGQVASVAGSTITVNSVDPQGNPSQITVTVTDTTTYTKKTVADAQAIAQGKCLTALGAKDGGGALQATAITVQQADNGQCPEAGGGHHRH